MKRGPRFPWDLKTQQTKTLIVCKNEDIVRLLFQSRKNVLVVSTFRFHAISLWKRKTIGRASRASTRFCVQRSAHPIFGTKCLVFQYLKTAHSDYRIGWRRAKGQDESTWRWLHTKDSERCAPFSESKTFLSGVDFSFPRDRRVDTKNDRSSLKDIKSVWLNGKKSILRGKVTQRVLLLINISRKYLSRTVLGLKSGRFWLEVSNENLNEHIWPPLRRNSKF